MSKEKITLKLEMVIDLPEGETRVHDRERQAIINNIYEYLTQVRTTSEDYEGCLDADLVKSETATGWKFALDIKEIIPQKEVYVFGDRVSRSIADATSFEDFKEEVSMYASSGFSFQVEEITNDTDPSYLLSQFDGWGGYVKLEDFEDGSVDEQVKFLEELHKD